MLQLLLLLLLLPPIRDLISNDDGDCLTHRLSAGLRVYAW